MSGAPPGSGEGYPLKAIEALFNGALERPAGDARDAWLAHATGGDAGLLAEVVELLGAHDTAGEFLDAPVLVPTEHADEAEIDAGVGSVIGPYTLVEKLGEGGFGTVFRAEQSEPVRREVALKVIKLGMDTRQVIARFEAERHALALMDHPAIARVLDAGSTDAGRPYFVMELAPGTDLTAFCDAERMGINERLQLFVELCGAIQHAHQRGVIHRDLKPSNVLVAQVESRIVAKVIDFGIAKATTDDLRNATLFTEAGQVIGTPVYMSPEQASGSGDIDTRADVYSLGVLLYELVSGGTPMRAEELRQRAIAGDIGTFVQDFVPAPPSTRWQAGMESQAAARGASLSEIRNAVRGDLDNVILCALESDRDRRYESAAGLARDVQRVLESRPIHANPPSTVHRFQKFLRRHRVAATAAAAVFVAIIAGAAVSIQSLRARQNQGTVLMAVLESTKGAAGRLDLDSSVASIERKTREAFGADAPIVVDALSTYADRASRQGKLETALEAHRAALAAAERIHGPRAAETTAARAAVGLQLLRGGELLEAQAELQLAVDRDAQENAPGSPALNEARLALGTLLADEGELESAEQLAFLADEIARSRASGDRKMRVETLELLVDLRQRLEDTGGAQEAWTALLAAYARLHPPGSPLVSSRRVDCGSWLASVGEDVAAARELRRAIQGLDPGKPREAQSLIRALAVLNSVYSENAGLVEPDVARSFIDAELGLVQENLEPGGSQHAASLRRIAGHLDRVGELGRALDIMIQRHRALEAALGSPGAKSSALAMSAEELGKRADYVRRVDGLADATYVSAREAVAIALEHEPSEESLLMAQVVLSARVSDFKSIFAHIQELKSSSQITGDHPLFLAMQAIAFNASPPTQPVSKMRLKAAIELARQPEYVDVPGLQETVRWAERFINGTE